MRLIKMPPIKPLLLIGLLFLVILVAFTIINKHSKKIDVYNTNDNYIRVGVILGTEQELMEAARDIAAKDYDLIIKVIPYSDIHGLNKALSDKEIDANVFQYPAFMEYSEQQHGYRLKEIGKTFIYPMGIYSLKYHNILQVPNGATVAIPNEPTNEARALFLLEKAGLIFMADQTNLAATTADIANNPHQLQFKKLPSNELVNVLPNVDLAVINASFALQAGLLPSSHALIIESKNSAYGNIVVTRQGQERDPGLKALVTILHSPEVEKEANKLFKGQAIPAWK